MGRKTKREVDNATVAVLTARFPRCFFNREADRQPLKIGIRAAIGGNVGVSAPIKRIIAIYANASYQTGLDRHSFAHNRRPPAYSADATSAIGVTSAFAFSSCLFASS